MTTDNINTITNLPYKSLEDILFQSGESINCSTINDKIIKLLSNDKAIYDIKNNTGNKIIHLPSNLSSLEGKVTSDLFVWSGLDSKYNNAKHDDSNLSKDQLIPLSSNSYRANICYPIIPYGIDIDIDKYPIPTKIPDLTGIHDYLKSLDVLGKNITNYSYILSYMYDYSLSVKSVSGDGKGDNILRYDIGLYALINKDEYYRELYNKGYRWVQGLMTSDCLDELSNFSNNIKLPIISFSKEENTNLSSSSTNDIDLCLTSNLSQHIFDDSSQRLTDCYENGCWFRENGSGFVEQGGVALIEFEEKDEGGIKYLTPNLSSITFPKKYDILFDVLVQPYSNYDISSIVKNTSDIDSCSIYVKSFNEDNSGFTIDITPTYTYSDLNGIIKPSSNTKTYKSFNVIWSAKGFINKGIDK